MRIKVITNFREFVINTEDMKTQNRGGVGISLFTLAKKQLTKGENLVRLEDIE